MRPVDLLREPLLHFLVAGALLFGLYDLVRDDGPAEDTIVITAADLARAEEAWRVQHQREPGPADLEALVEAAVREEVLVREARALGLGEADPLVRRRLAQKMEFLLAEGEPPSPDDATLRAWWEARPRDLAFEEARDDALVEWLDARRLEADEAAWLRLRDRYEVVLQPVPTEAVAP